MPVKDIKRSIQEIQDIVISLRQNQDYVWNKVNSQISGIAALMAEFLEYINTKKLENEIPINIILQQIQNLNDAYNSRDYVMMADTLEYEISNALCVYIEVKEKLDGISEE